MLQAQEEAYGPCAFQMLQLAKLQAEPGIIYTSSKVSLLSCTFGTPFLLFADSWLLLAGRPWFTRGPQAAGTARCVKACNASSVIKRIIPGMAAGETAAEVRLEKSSLFHPEKARCSFPA